MVVVAELCRLWATLFFFVVVVALTSFTREVWSAASDLYKRPWLAECPLPKLFINSEPGAVLVGEHRDMVRRWPNLTEVTVSGLHYIHEDSPVDIGRALADWYKSID